MATLNPILGQTIGQLEIKRQIGQGGMGAVYYAEHAVLGTARAIKVLLPQWSQYEVMSRRFLNEARAAARIKHRNVVGVHDCGQLEDGTLYIVMDYLQGETLSQCCRSYRGPMPLDHVVRLLAAVANGLEAAHAAGIVHRDLKPDNVILVRHEQNDRHPVIVDFGISKLGDGEEGGLTRTGMLAGTPIYMSPEQMRDLKVVDRRSDVYALGVIAYQMVTGGWLPYQAEYEFYEQYSQLSAAEIYHRQMSQQFVDPRQRCDAVNDGCAMAIRAAVDLDPSRRPSPRAFALQLAESIAGGDDILREYARELVVTDNVLVRTAHQSNSSGTGRISRYEIGARLGVGGMAEVFRATALGAEGFARSVALKRVLPGYSTTPQFASMFIQEAQLAAQLSHANVVSVLDFDRDAEGRLFLVTEWVDGVDLAALAATGLFPFSSVIFAISEVLRGLGYAHELPLGGPVRGVIHRDVSPHNVLLSWDGSVKVSDFGIAKARHAGSATATDVVRGKPAYMSPEQANAEPLDGRSDLFAVGVIAWELLTGRGLFDAVTTNGTIAQVLFKVIDRPSQVRPGVPPELDAIVMRLLERDLSKRYATAEAAIDDLSRCAHAPRNGRSELARVMAERFNRSMPHLSQPQMSSQPTTIGSAAGQSTVQRRRGKRALIAAALTIGVGGSAALVWTLRDPTPAPSTPAVAPTPAIVAPIERPTEPTRDVSITITTAPPGAEVHVDGVQHGAAPVTMTVARGARLSLEARLAGHQLISTTITVERDGQRIDLALPVTAPLDAGVPAKKEPVAKPTGAKPGQKQRSKRGSAAFEPDEFDPNSVGGVD